MTDLEEKRRIRAGLQCPECYGVRVLTLHGTKTGKYQCNECGCLWDRYYCPSYPKAEIQRS